MNINEALMVIPRCFISILFLFIVTKIIGKKQVSQLSLFDYVIGISIGNFIAEMTMNTDIQYINGIVAMMVFGIVSYVVSFITMKSITLRRFLIGVPTIIIEDGKIIEKSLKVTNIDINDFLEQCRIKGYFNINDISYAIMEASGDISILPKSNMTPLVQKDMNVKTSNATLTPNIIIDGKFMPNNIKSSNLSIKKIKDELKKQHIKTEEDILLGVYQNNKYTFYKKNIETKNYSLLE